MSTSSDTVGGAVTVRLVMPDRWLEQVADFPLTALVADVKAEGLQMLLQRDVDDPDDYYVEYAERQVTDESRSLAEIGFQPREIFAIRAYDLGHYRRFEG
jgi:hypothetical protein